jgi:hypothetical protein
MLWGKSGAGLKKAQEDCGIYGPSFLTRLAYYDRYQLERAPRPDLMHQTAIIASDILWAVEKSHSGAVLSEIRRRAGAIRMPATFPIAALTVLRQLGQTTPEWNSHDKMSLLTSGVLQAVLVGVIRRDLFDLIRDTSNLLVTLWGVVVVESEHSKLVELKKLVQRQWKTVLPSSYSTLQIHNLDHSVEYRDDGTGVFASCLSFERVYGVLTHGSQATITPEMTLAFVQLMRTAVQSLEDARSGERDAVFAPILSDAAVNAEAVLYGTFHGRRRAERVLTPNESNLLRKAAADYDGRTLPADSTLCVLRSSRATLRGSLFCSQEDEGGGGDGKGGDRGGAGEGGEGDGGAEGHPRLALAAHRHWRRERQGIPAHHRRRHADARSKASGLRAAARPSQTQRSR